MDLKSSKFRYIETNLLKIFTLIYENSAVSKYIYYLVDDPLSEPDVPIDLLENGNYLFTFFDGKVTDEEKIRMFINPTSGNFKNKSLGDISYLIEILIPNKYCILNGMGEFRAFRIMDQISMMIDQQMVAGMTPTEIINFKSGRVTNAEYTVFSIEILVKSSTLKNKR